MNLRRHSTQRCVVIIGCIAAVVIFSLPFLLQKEEKSILHELQNKNGYIRTIESEEYEFFKKLVKREYNESLSTEELEHLTKEKINRVNAEFILGYQMGLCGPYSFESFCRDMEIENTLRKIKKEKNEVFYGPEQFDLVTYYTYMTGNLKLDMVTYIMKNADSEVQKGAKEYFQKYREKYRTIEKIVYSVSEKGNTKEQTLLYRDMSSLEKTDSYLFEFLFSGKPNDKMEYVYQDNLRKIEIESVKYEKLNYANNAERVMRDYITNDYLENWILEIEENYQVEFK